MLDYLKKWRAYFYYGAFFSFFINLLQLTFTVYSMLVFEKATVSNSLPTLLVITFLAFMAIVAGTLLDVVRNRLLVRLGMQIDLDLSGPVFTAMMREVSRAPGSAATAALRDVAVLRNYLSGSTVFCFFDLPLTVICIAFIFTLNPLLGYVALGGGSISVILGIVAERVARTSIDRATVINSKSSHLIGQALRNSEAVMSMGMAPGIMAKWNALNYEVLNLQTKASQQSGLLEAIIRGMRTFLMIALTCAGAYLIISGHGSPGIMIGAGIAMGRALSPIDVGVATFKQSLEARASYKRLSALFDQPREPRVMEMPVPQGALQCEGVTFIIQGRPLLLGVSFQLAAGLSMGLIGPSAAGKSTLCRLLVGLWPPTQGFVRYDGADIHSWSQDSRGKFIGYMPQDVELFSGTVAENISRLNEVNADQVLEAARLAGAHDMILQLHNGYATEIGPGGAALSGGQRQRIALARALYGQPRVLVLDEPSSNLDNAGERALMQTLDELKKTGITVVIVSHKPSTIAHVDMILVLKEGQVAMFGPRAEILRELVGSSGSQR